jgi:capsular polysaccharide biosynthesis protein
MNARPEAHAIARLLEPFEVERQLPANLDPDDEPIFRPEYQRRFGATDLFLLRNVLITRDGVVVAGRRAVPDLEYFPGETARLGLRYVVRSRLARRRRFDDGERYVTAFNRWSGNNYFHWLCDVLPRVYLARSYVEDSTFVLPASHEVPFVEKSLAPFRPRRIVYFGPDETAFFPEVTVPGHIAVTGNYHEPTMRELADFLLGALRGAEAPPVGPRVYVSRRRAKHRHVINEDEVVSLVEGYGFEVVENEALSFEEQVALYSKTAILIGIIGANLANVLFMPPGSSLVQLTRNVDVSNHLYYSLASAKGVRFYYQRCDHVEAGYGDRWNIQVDVNRLEAILQQIVEPV